MNQGPACIRPPRWPAQEFPDLDVSVRGAISIGRRLMDPLAELVKIDPKRHRRGPVSARCGSKVPQGRPGRRGGQLRQRRGCGTQHCQRPAAELCLGPGAVVGQGIVEHRTQNGPSPRVRPSLRCPAWGPRPLSRRRVSCGSETAKIPWTPARCTPSLMPLSRPWPGIWTARWTT